MSRKAFLYQVHSINYFRDELNNKREHTHTHMPTHRNRTERLNFYRPPMKLRKGNVFRGVCQSFCSLGEVSLVPCPFWDISGMSKGRWVCLGVCPGVVGYVPG